MVMESRLKVGSGSTYASKTWECINNIQLLGWTVPEIHTTSIQGKMMMMIFPIPCTQTTLQFCHILLRNNKWRQFNNHVFLVLCICCFCSDLTTAKIHPHMQTNMRANSLHLKNWRISENYFGLPFCNKTSRSSRTACTTAELPEEFGCTVLKWRQLITPAPESLSTELNRCKLLFLEWKTERKRCPKAVNEYR